MQSGGGPRTPVLVLSADVTPEAIQRCTQAGAYSFMAKPVVAVKLLESIAEIASNERSSVASTVIRPVLAADGVLDASVLDELAALGMGKGFEREFIRQCLTDARSCLGAIEASAETGDWARMRDHAHAIKGVASNLGLVKVAAQGGEMMGMADWQLTAEWRRRHTQLVASLSEGRASLDARSSDASTAQDDSETR
jgi:two-component system sensor histidine kinase RpfC